MATFTRLRADRPVRWSTILGLLLVPVTVAGLLLWGLWKPDARLESITAAVVNLDEPVTVDGQTVPLGRVLAGELIGGADGSEDAGDAGGAAGTDTATGRDADADTDADAATASNFTWVLTDAADASAGAEDGRYAAVVTIPEDFSAAATSASRGIDEAEQAMIEVQTSDRGRLLDSALAGIVMSTATGVLNQTLGEQSVASVFVSMNELGDGIADAADGAGRLADGGSQLADGVDELAGGAGELAAGTGEFVDGVGTLSAGAGDLASGSSEFADGAAKLSKGVGALATGAGDLATGAGDLATGAKQAAAGGQTLADGVKGYTDGVNTAIGGLQQGAAAAIAPLQQYRDAIADDTIPMPSPEAKEQALAGLDQLLAQLGALSSEDPETDLNQLKAGGTGLAKGAQDSADGQKKLATGAKKLAKGASKLSDGVDELETGTSTLATGARKLSTGTSAFADGASLLAAGGAQLATGTTELASGTEQLATGARQSAVGAQGLADGLQTAADQIPSTTEAQRTALAETMVSPVRAEGASGELFNAAGVPLFAGIALWAGSLASFLVLAPLWRRTREAARGVGAIALRSARPALVLGVAQGLLAGLILPPLLGYDPGQWLAFLGLSVVAGVSFALVNQGLSALLGGFGRFLSFALLVGAFAIGVVSTAPPLLQAVGDASPIGALFAGFQAAAMETAGVGAAFGVLTLWALGGFALTAFAVARERKRPVAA